MKSMSSADLSQPKLPPQNLEAEQSVLGAVLLDNSAMAKASELLVEENFYRTSHRKIYRAMEELSATGEVIDQITLTERLKAQGDIEAIGGAAYLAELVQGVASSANIRYHCKIVRDKALLRELIHSSTEVLTRGYEGTSSVDDLLDFAEQSVFSIAQGKLDKSFTPLNSIIKESLDLVDKLSKRKEHITGVPTGFYDLDDITAGLQPSDLVVIAGRPSMGKTSLALGMAVHAAIHAGSVVGIFSLEMSKPQIVLRMLSSEARVDSHGLRTGKLQKEDWWRLAEAAGRLEQAPIYIDDTGGITVQQMRGKARRLKAEKGLDLLIVDYLQLMQGRSDSESRQQEISDISRSLKALAKELNVPVVALSQLSRAVEARKPPVPMLADLRECVTGETLVSLSDGRRVPVKDLVESSPDVLAVSEEGRVIHAQSDKVWRVGSRPIFSVRLASGRTIRATAEHRLLGAGGWKRIKEMNVGDRLAVARELPEPSTIERWPDRRIALLGQLIGDGSYLRHQPMRYTTSSEENSEIVAEAAREEFGAEVKRYKGRRTWHQLLISRNGNRWHPAGVNLWLREFGIFGQRSYEKRIPGCAFRLGNAQIGLLLRHLWATDGSITPRAKGRGDHAVFFSTNSLGLAQDVAALLLRLGIVARLQQVQQGKYRPMHIVRVSGGADQQRFLDRVGAFGPRKAGAEKLADALKGKAHNTNVDTVPIEVFSDVKRAMRERGISQRQIASLRGTSYGGASHFQFAPSRSMLAEYATILEDGALASQATSDLFWDRIVSIEPDGMEEVFDLTVPGPASWLADGIVSHNSGAIEQDADVVMFIYREDVYDQNSERKGIADILVSKHRNGPIGRKELFFHDRFAKFESLDNREVV
ncbi:MAG: replicative DNA helicase [Nitrospira sp. CG24E]|nr:MAG: replicative DNA helicase [Nitrospira sp. CG24E]